MALRRYDCREVAYLETDFFGKRFSYEYSINLHPGLRINFGFGENARGARLCELKSLFRFRLRGHVNAFKYCSIGQVASLNQDSLIKRGGRAANMRQFAKSLDDLAIVLNRSSGLVREV